MNFFNLKDYSVIHYREIVSNDGLSCKASLTNYYGNRITLFTVLDLLKHCDQSREYRKKFILYSLYNLMQPEDLEFKVRNGL